MYGLLSFFLVFLPGRRTVLAALFRKLQTLGNDDLLRDFSIKRGHVVVAIAIVEDADHSAMGTMERPHDAAFGATVGTKCGDLHQHAIAVHGRTDSRRRD